MSKANIDSSILARWCQNYTGPLADMRPDHDAERWEADANINQVEAWLMIAPEDAMRHNSRRNICEVCGLAYHDKQRAIDCCKPLANTRTNLPKKPISISDPPTHYAIKVLTYLLFTRKDIAKATDLPVARVNSTYQAERLRIIKRMGITQDEFNAKRKQVNGPGKRNEADKEAQEA